jgi:signal peptidase I
MTKNDVHSTNGTKGKRDRISYPLLFLTVLFFSIAIRLFVIEIYSIPSGSMEDTILSGDKVLMSKLSYGPRLPSSPFEIPWINLAFYLGKNQRTKTDSVWWKYKRLFGFSRVKHSQLIVFNSPKNSKEILIKRCMGIPGDTILIRDEKVFANHKEIPPIGTVKLISRIIFSNYAMASSLFDSMGLEKYNRLGGKNYFSAPLSNDKKDVLLKYHWIDSVIIERNRPDTSFKTFPNNEIFHWTIDNFGPIVIPAKGITIKLNKENFILYRRIINIYENAGLTTRAGKYFLNGIESTSFTFKNNYYFMLGDNRHDSNDSRYWGFVPEQYIIGKAFMVLFSNGEDGFRWNRFFKIIK